MSAREELVKAVEDAAASWAAVDAADAAYDAYAAGKAYAVWYALNDAQDALKAYDKESNDSFHNFAECLCESYQREELVKAVEDASDAFYAADDTKDYYYNAYVIADAALAAYDKENNT